MKASDIIKKFEGYSDKAYKCPAGIWTIGYGFTSIPCSLVGKTGDTRPVKEGDLIKNKELADDYLDILIEDFKDKVLNLITVDVTENQLNALISFAFNLGVGALKKSTLLKKFNSGDSTTSSEFLKWNKVGNKVLAGLTRRRELEKEVFEKE
jgi:GH24 family phage-related lysozyme (muramidase)